MMIDRGKNANVRLAVKLGFVALFFFCLVVIVQFL